MVQAVLTRRPITAKLWICVMVVFWLWFPAEAARVKSDPNLPPPPDLLLEGGRKLAFEQTFSSERDALGQRGFWTKVLDVVAGEPQRHFMIRPYGIAVDSRGRAIVTDPGMGGIHIFDFEQHKYKFIARKNKDDNSLRSPQCVAVDAQDNIYVTDSESGKIFVFGSLRGGEGYFKRPTGIAVDSSMQRIYVTDTLRNKVFVLNMDGSVIQTIGATGDRIGEFNFPTELLLHGNEIAVVDAMNFRVQIFDRSGNFHYTVGALGDGIGSFFRPKGIGFDGEGHLYVVDGAWNTVQIFDDKAELLYNFGTRGSELGAFELPSGLFITRNDRIYVVDSSNRRVQVFRYYGKPAEEGKR
jgi:DNA-binding beta-propeller fold protein YncE